MSGIKYTDAAKSYAPCDKLVNLINGLLLYRDRKEELHGKKTRVGGMTQEQIEKERKKLYKEKVNVLNKHIFPAMANLTVLVEAMQEESYIRDKFEDDLSALFLTKGKNNKSIFERFIAASCTLTSAVDHKTKKKMLSLDFRLILLNIMQQTIYRKMEVIGPLKFDDPYSWKKTLKLDMERAAAWTKEIAHEALMKELIDEARRKKHSENVRRPVLF